MSEKNLNLASIITQAKQILDKDANLINKTQSSHRLLGRLSKIPNIDPVKKCNESFAKENQTFLGIY
jgi:hypothetical protein